MEMILTDPSNLAIPVPSPELNLDQRALGHVESLTDATKRSTYFVPHN